ncbi:MAG TPA: hypothetical protein VMG31_01400 [Verrucomicrobiae bacterium]|nr:hypothetical protein [Verrucomicrobiae bacterium]
MTHSHALLMVALLLPLSAIPFSSAFGQETPRDSASMTISPTKATLHVGQQQTFKLVAKGTRRAKIRWAVQEPDGGQITESGVYTAPQHMGLYHVVATSEENPDARAVAKITVVTEYDTPDWLLEPKL